MLKRAAPLAGILLLYAVMSAVGITWGLPSARIDRYLFGGGPAWPGEKIARLAKVSEKVSATRGADVDADPLQVSARGPINLTATEADAAAIYLRFRLYTHQPDEMITMMALAGMKPRQLELDPRLYQYGGLFVYPVGAAIGLAGALGLVHVTSDLTWYLDHPDEFGKFYVIARTYVALWGALGVALVYGLARAGTEGWTRPRRKRPRGAEGGAGPRDRATEGEKTPLTTHHSPVTPDSAGFLAAVLFALLPVTVCMAHEAKPHLPGAVLMLAATYFCAKYVNSEFRIQNSKAVRDAWLLMCLSCGAAFGMVLSAWPIFVLIPLTEILRRVNAASRSPSSVRTPHSALRTLSGIALALSVYLLTNPYVAINAVTNRDVLISNLRNSTAMYEAGQAGEGLIRALELIAEGAGPVVLVMGGLGVLVMLLRPGRRAAMLLFVPAGVLFAQFVLLAAGKPAEYGRFGVFIAAALAIAAARLAGAVYARTRIGGTMAALLMVMGTGYGGGKYLCNFYRDTGLGDTREQLAAVLTDPHSALCVLADPAPYNCPPLPFDRVTLLRYPSREAYKADPRFPLLEPLDSAVASLPDGWTMTQVGGRPFSPISWANKPFVLIIPPE